MIENDLKLSDAELVSALRTEKDLDVAIRYLYKKYFGMATAYVLKNSGQPADAEDIFQEAVVMFIDSVQKDKFRGDSTVSTFLYAIVKHAWLNEMKKRGRSRFRDEKFELSKDQIDMDAATIIANRESRNLLFSTINKLGKTCKKILVAFYFEKMEMKQILEFLNYDNEQVVRNKKYKCMKELQEMVFSQPTLSKNLKSILNYE